MYLVSSLKEHQATEEQRSSCLVCPWFALILNLILIWKWYTPNNATASAIIISKYLPPFHVVFIATFTTVTICQHMRLMMKRASHTYIFTIYDCWLCLLWSHAWRIYCSCGGSNLTFCIFIEALLAEVIVWLLLWKSKNSLAVLALVFYLTPTWKYLCLKSRWLLLHMSTRLLLVFRLISSL